MARRTLPTSRDAWWALRPRAEQRRDAHRQLAGLRPSCNGCWHRRTGPTGTMQSDASSPTRSSTYSMADGTTSRSVTLGSCPSLGEHGPACLRATATIVEPQRAGRQDGGPVQGRGSRRMSARSRCTSGRGACCRGRSTSTIWPIYRRGSARRPPPRQLDWLLPGGCCRCDAGRAQRGRGAPLAARALHAQRPALAGGDAASGDAALCASGAIGPARGLYRMPHHQQQGPPYLQPATGAFTTAAADSGDGGSTGG